MTYRTFLVQIRTYFAGLYEGLILVLQIEIHLFSSAMEAPSTCTPPAARIRSTPPGRRSSITSPEDQRLRLLFTEAEYDIITKKCNSQWMKAWIYFYRLCLKDPLAFALVK